MIRQIIYTLIIYLAGISLLHAQLQEKDMQFLEQVSSHYANGYQMEVMVYAFPKESTQAMVLDSCFTARQQDNILITTRNYDILQSPDYTLTANHLNKEINIVSSKKDTIQLINKFEFNTDELEQSSTIFSTRRDGQHLLFEATDLDIYTKIAYHFDITTYALNKVIYNYADSEEGGTPHKVEIQYGKVKINQPVSKDVFDLKQYVHPKNGTFTVNEKYHKYQLNQNL